MKNKAGLFGIYLPVFALIALATVAIRTVALFLHFDAETGYYSNKILISVSDYVIIGISIFFLTYIFTARRDISLIPDFTSAATYIPTGIVSAALLFMPFALIKRAGDILDFIDELKASAYQSAHSQIPSQRLLFAVVIITALFAVASLVHFALTALIENHSNSKRANFGLCTVIFLSLYAMYLYFSNELPINSPNKALDQMAYLFGAVFFLYETRLSFGRERWRPYIAFGFIAATVAAYSSVPSLIYYVIRGEVTQNSIYELMLTFALFVFITSRILLTAKLTEDRSSQTVLALATASDARTEEINPTPKTAEVIEIVGEPIEESEEEAENDENQITIEELSALSENITQDSEEEIAKPEEEEK